MPPELDEVRGWLRKADHDRRMAEAGLREDPPITDAAAFHCQQAVEKLLKAYLVWKQHEFEKIHDLRALVLACATHDQAFQTLEPRVAPLTAYAVRFRYPGPSEPTPEQVQAALQVVEQVRGFVLDRLPNDLKTTSNEY